MSNYCEVCILLAAQHRQRRSGMCMAVDHHDRDSTPSDDSLCREPITDGCVVIVPVNSIQCTNLFERAEDAIGNEIASVEDGVCRPHRFSRPTRQTAAVSTMRIREDDQHASVLTMTR